MRLYLKNKKNKTLFEAQLWIKSEVEYSYIELTTNLNIKNYSLFLIDNLNKKDKIIRDFTNLNDLRGWLWERFFNGNTNNPSKMDEVSKKLIIILEKVANDYNIKLIRDDYN